MRRARARFWWIWIYTTWATNWLDPVRLPVRGAIIGLVMSSSIYESFGDRGAGLNRLLCHLAARTHRVRVAGGRPARQGAASHPPADIRLDPGRRELVEYRRPSSARMATTALRHRPGHRIPLRQPKCPRARSGKIHRRRLGHLRRPHRRAERSMSNPRPRGVLPLHRFRIHRPGHMT
ncbi:MAG: low temperature requirement protein A [Candidatus Saccharibacteria bacterium]|nr:low temperature requirement protein A [Microbacteriaceae bacterium]